jgi:hypothetical protein
MSDTIEQQIDSIISLTTDNLIDKFTNDVNQSEDIETKSNGTNGSSESFNNDTGEDADDNTDDEPPEIDAESTEVFNFALQQYMALTDEIKVLSDSIKQRNTQKKNYSHSMLAYLNRYKIKNISLNGDYKNKVINTDTKIVSTGFSRRVVVEVLHECLEHDEQLFEKIMSKLSEKMTDKEVSKLNLIDNSKTKTTKKDIQKQKNQNIDNILNTCDNEIPENMKYLYKA